jgi:molybdate-binding protein/DNA-binding transcriptional regulator YhcF (GntR family)
VYPNSVGAPTEFGCDLDRVYLGYVKEYNYNCVDTIDTTMKKKYSSLYVQIAESVRRRIASGELKPGEKLAPVRHMAKEWDCTPGTVNRAYAALAEEGLVFGRRGKGTFVSAGRIQPADSAWEWAALVNRAERFLLEAVSDGHDPLVVQNSLSIAIARWQEMRDKDGIDGLPAAPDMENQIRFAGSHDLVIQIIEKTLNEPAQAPELTLAFIGSLGGLIALAQGKADLAGAHLWDEYSDTYNIPFVQRILPGRCVVLLTLAHRQLGIIIPPGNPQRINNMEDLCGEGVRFVNRQPGSGTRLWLEAQWKLRSLPSDRIVLSGREMTTHLGIAEAIARDEATAGLGIYSAANTYDLDFIPLTLERYDLIIPAENWEQPGIQAIVNIVRSERFRITLQSLGGYEVRQTGEEIWIGE